MEARFPRCMKAGKRVDLDQWALADALLAETQDRETGPDGYKAVVNEFADLLGLEYETRYLRMLRQAAEVFSPSTRYDGEHNRPIVALRAHIAAGNPEMLDVIVKAGRKDGQKISLNYIESVLRRKREELREERKTEKAEAMAEAAAAEEEEHKATQRRKHAKTKEDHDAAEKQRDAARNKKRSARNRAKNIKVAPPRREMPPPKEEEVGGLFLKTRFMADIGQISLMIKRMSNDIEPAVNELTPAFVNAAVEELLDAANQLRALSELIRRGQSNKRGHLSVVNE